WEMNGQAVKMLPTAATAPVATKRKSRRVAWSAEDVVVVTIPNPFLSSAPGGTAPKTPHRAHPRRDHAQDVTGDGLPAPATPAAAERPAFSAKAAKPAVQNRSIGTLAGRAQARYRPPSVQCTKSAQDRSFIDTFMKARGCRSRFFSP